MLRFAAALAAIALPIVPSVAFAGDNAQRSNEELVLRDPLPPEALADENVSKILFVNPCWEGCQITPGPNDSRLNTSSIAAKTGTVQPFRHGEAVWAEVMQCIREVYAPYDVEVTDVDPGPNVLHHEAIAAGTTEDIGLGGGIGGIAPFGCQPVNNVISFTFANQYSNPQTICAVIAQESAHSYGLEHAFDCSDPLTYLNACGRQFFRDKVSECGEFSPRTCECGGSAQNSHRWLKQVLGDNPDPVPGPSVSVQTPAAGEMVSGEFNVVVEATHMRGVGRVELWINGTQYDTLEGHPYNQASEPYWFKAPGQLANSILDVEVRAYNDIDSETIHTLTVTKGAACQSADTCEDGQLCTDGRCHWPIPVAELGDDCGNDAECVSGLCLIAADGEAHCTEECFPTTTENTCPEGFECLDLGSNQGRCWPESATSGCGCAAGSTSPRGALGSLLLALGVFVVVRRRRRR